LSAPRRPRHDFATLHLKNGPAQQTTRHSHHPERGVSLFWLSRTWWPCGADPAPEDVGAALRVAVGQDLHRQPSARPPAPHHRKIPASRPHPFHLVRGRFATRESYLGQFAMDPAQLTNVFGEAKMPRTSSQAGSRIARLHLGRLTADKLQTQDRGPHPLVGHSTRHARVEPPGHYQGTVATATALSHKYLDEAGPRRLGGCGGCGALPGGHAGRVVETINKTLRTPRRSAG